MHRLPGMVLVLLLARLQWATSNIENTNYTAGSETEAGNGSGTGTEEPVAPLTSAAGAGAVRGAGTSSPTQPGDGARAPSYTPAAPKEGAGDSATSTGGIPPSASPVDSPTAPRASTAVTADAPGGSGPGTTLSSQGSAGTAAAPDGSQDAHGAKSNKGGVIFGVLLGTILGFALFGLIGYFICGKKNSETFSHRRLYEDTRSESVPPLDNLRGPRDAAFGGTRRDTTRAPDKEGDAGCPAGDVAMGDMTSAQPSE